MPERVTLRDVAERINDYLWCRHAGYAWNPGRCVRITYTDDPSVTDLMDEGEALAYLAWLDAGGNGKHTEMPK